MDKINKYIYIKKFKYINYKDSSVKIFNPLRKMQVFCTLKNLFYIK